MNLKMPELRKCFESAGFTEVTTLLSSGNVAFNAKVAASSLEHRAEEAMSTVLGRKFYTIIRSVSDLRAMIDTDPYEKHSLPESAKRVVTFMREPRKPKLPIPLELDGARILETHAREAFSAYVPGPRGPVFMRLIEKAFGSEVTTRTWETVKKCAKA